MLVVVHAGYGVTDQAVKPLEKMVTSAGGLISIVRPRMDDHHYHDVHQGESPYYGRSSDNAVDLTPETDALGET